MQMTDLEFCLAGTLVSVRRAGPVQHVEPEPRAGARNSPAETGLVVRNTRDYLQAPTDVTACQVTLDRPLQMSLHAR